MTEEMVSCKFGNNNILVSRIVPCRDKLNAKATQVNIHLKNEINERNICFMGNSNINPKNDCNKGSIHSNKSRTNKLIESICLP